MIFIRHYKSLLLLLAAILLVAGPGASASEFDAANSVLVTDNGHRKNWDRDKNPSQRKEMRDRHKEMRENKRDQRREWQEERRNDRNNWREDRREDRHNWREGRRDYRHDRNNAGAPPHDGSPNHRPDMRPDRPGPNMSGQPEPGRPGMPGNQGRPPMPPHER